MNNEKAMQNIVDEFTLALLANDHHAHDILAEYDGIAYDDIAYDEARALMALIDEIHQAMPLVTPNPQYRARLKHDLLNKRPTVLARWRFLPARVQMAAASVVLGGFLLLLRGWFLGEGRTQRRNLEKIA